MNRKRFGADPFTKLLLLDDRINQLSKRLKLERKSMDAKLKKLNRVSARLDQEIADKTLERDELVAKLLAKRFQT